MYFVPEVHFTSPSPTEISNCWLEIVAAAGGGVRAGAQSGRNRRIGRGLVIAARRGRRDNVRDRAGLASDGDAFSRRES